MLNKRKGHVSKRDNYEDYDDNRFSDGKGKRTGKKSRNNMKQNLRKELYNY